MQKIALGSVSVASVPVKREQMALYKYFGVAEKIRIARNIGVAVVWVSVCSCDTDTAANGLRVSKGQNIQAL